MRFSWTARGETAEPTRLSPWVELVYDAGIENLKAQRDELSGMRTRAVAVSAMTIAASGLLVGQGLSRSVDGRSLWFYVLASTGTVGFVVLAALLTAMLLPAWKFQFLLDPAVLIRWTSDPVRPRTEAMALLRLTSHVLPSMIRFNEERLTSIRILYRSTLASAFATVGVWVTVIWIFA